MTMAPAYLFKILGNPTIEISQAELRSLLGEIETQLHRSQVYRQALAKLQTLLGSSEEAKNLFKAIGREAIGLAFQNFAHHAKVADSNQQTNTEPEKSSNVANSIPSNHLNQQPTNTDVLSISLVTEDTSKAVTQNPENSAKKHPIPKLMNWLQPNQKKANVELAQQQLAAQRLAIMSQIGQQLRQAREARGFCLRDLSIFTHLPTHQMEAVENGDLESLPEDILVRGFIRVMGNALGLNGTSLANSLPMVNTVPSVLPSWSQSKHNSPSMGLELRPIHLYLGYTALVAGTVGGLSVMSQPGKIDTTVNPDASSSSPVSQTNKNPEPNAKPGIKSSAAGISVGSDIAPPEAL
ncbi:RodZ family helix-turn-helix domain-containing protein [Aulosira sp. FACHB-615]|uniref:helix-turn-helix domain-containing protein n=1 Tax=Aulosira sp. FACHB-615 TaxID=2692777 RepID=UPI0016894DA0|nr:helix-turn-helix domain-containing protein [Aulosira sp. FACHB-615]MBD2485994.1 helix-turn-helix domain-containing protein [Aulosira sp. FACHB-615]